MGLLKEFRDFALKGNVLDLAVGVIIGAAFGGIVKSLIEDIIMPAVGYFTHGVDLSTHKIVLQDAAAAKVLDGKNVPAVSEIAIRVGSFATLVINFLILAFCIFIVVKIFNAARKRFEHQAAAAPAAPTTDQKLLMEIRDLLAKKS